MEPSLPQAARNLGVKLKALRLPPIRNALLRKELPWLVAEVVLLLILFNANAPELWFWLVVLLVVLGYRVERWWTSRPQA